MADRTEHDSRLGALMQAAQVGDADAYHELLESILPLLRRVIGRRRAVLGGDEVEDLVQDVLMSVHGVRATYDPGRPFLPWLLAITRHRLADSARRHARRAGREVIVNDLDVTFSREDPNFKTDAYGDPKALARAIEQLPRGQRVAIELLKVRGLSLKEAAAASGLTTGALKVATHRAIVALRRILTKV